MNNLRAELRKLLSVRSTYVLVALGIILTVGVIAGLIYGYNDVGNAAANSRALRTALRQVIPIGVLFITFVTVLSIGHEYRYNTILYSLTGMRRRLTLVVSKYCVGLLFSVTCVMVIAVLSILGFSVGHALHGIAIMPQLMPGWDLVWRNMVYVVGYYTLAFIVTLTIRSLIGAIAFILIVPGTVEGILSLVLKENVRYLPYTALSNLIMPTASAPATLSLLVIIAYTAGLGALAVLLFMRRDAS